MPIDDDEDRCTVGLTEAEERPRRNVHSVLADLDRPREIRFALLDEAMADFARPLVALQILLLAAGIVGDLGAELMRRRIDDVGTDLDFVAARLRMDRLVEPAGLAERLRIG